MDTHTLELLEFDRIRTLVAARAACSLGKEAARRMEPSRDPGEIRSRQALTTEMAEALSSGLTPPFGGLHDIRPQVRRAQVGAMLDEELHHRIGAVLGGAVERRLVRRGRCGRHLTAAQAGAGRDDVLILS